MSFWQNIPLPIILAAIAVVYLLAKYLVKKWIPQTHRFWDKQPVSRSYSKQGVLVTQKLPPINTPPFTAIHLDPVQTQSCEKLTTFLNKHFIRGYRYTPEFIQWAFSHTPADNTCLVNPTNQKIVGTISGKDMDISIMGKRQVMTYVDYLAVDKSLRGKRLATGLISRLTSSTRRSSCIFKVESEPLPFDYVCRFRYYSYHLNSSNSFTELATSNTPRHPIHPLRERDIPDAYRFYLEQSQAFTLSGQYTQNDFQRWFLPRNNLVYTFIRRNSDGVLTFLASFFRCDFVMESFWGSQSKPIPMAELLFLLSEDKLTDAKELLREAKKTGCEYFVCPNTGKNTVFMDRLSFYGGKSCYLQLYNYGTTRELHPSEVLFNPP